MMTHVMACIDNSQSSLAVCDGAVWASQRLSAPLTLLHVLDQERYPVSSDLSGNIGLGSREHLLEELAALDSQRAKLALEQGRHLLETAHERIATAGCDISELKQLHGHLAESLSELEDDIRLLVIGRSGEHSAGTAHSLGSQIEAVIRNFHRPILITTDSFKKPDKVMLAFDGSATGQKTIQALISSPLLTGLQVHIVMVGPDSEENKGKLDRARGALVGSGLQVQAQIRSGEVELTLEAYQAEHGIDLLIMGAYGHSRIRQFLVGSTTTTILRNTTLPVLLLR